MARQYSRFCFDSVISKFKVNDRVDACACQLGPAARHSYHLTICLAHHSSKVALDGSLVEARNTSMTQHPPDPTLARFE